MGQININIPPDSQAWLLKDDNDPLLHIAAERKPIGWRELLACVLTVFDLGSAGKAH